MAKIPKMIHCSKCGKEIEQSIEICQGCGVKRNLFQRYPIRSPLIVLVTFLIVTRGCSGKKATSPQENVPKIEEKIETLATDAVETLAIDSVKIEKTYKADCKVYAYKTIARRPDEFKGKKARFKGEVVQISEDWLGNILRVDTKYSEYIGYSGDTIYVDYVAKEGEARILDGDIITFWGELDGIQTYETVLGSKVSIPRIIMAYYQIAE